MKKKPSIGALARKAWKLQSEIARLSAAYYDGFADCITCGIAIKWNSGDIHAGHFIHISKRHPLSYDDRNIHPQCARCNYFRAKGMASIEYTMWMVRKYGIGIVQELKARKSEPYYRRLEFEKLIDELKAKRAQLTET